MVNHSATKLIEEFELQTWDRSPEELVSWRRDFLQRCRTSNCDLDSLLTNQSDETLAIAVRKQSFLNECYRELMWERYRPLLNTWFGRFARRSGFILDPDKAEELAQDFLVNLLVNRFGNYTGNRPLIGYLHQAAHNHFVQRIHRVKRMQSLHSWQDSPVGGDLTANAYYRELLAAAHELPEVEGNVMRLLLQGNEIGDIAETLGLSKQKVYRMRFKAWKKLDARFGFDVTPTTASSETEARCEPCQNI